MLDIVENQSFPRIDREYFAYELYNFCYEYSLSIPSRNDVSVILTIGHHNFICISQIWTTGFVMNV